MAQQPRKTDQSAKTLCDVAYMSHDKALRSFVMSRLKNKDAADDAVQRTYEALLEVRADMPTDPKAYIFRVAANMCNDDHRAGKRLVVDSVRVDEIIELRTDVFSSGPAEAVSSREVLDMFLGQLPLEHKITVLLRYRDGFSHADIVAKAEFSPRAVKRYLGEARACLKRLLKEQTGNAPGGHYG